MYTLAVNLTAPVVGLSTSAAIARQYFEHDRIKFANYITNCLYIVSVTFSLVFFSALLFSRSISGVISVPSGWIWTVVLVALTKYLTNTVLVLWQVQFKPKPYAVFSFLQTITSFGFTVLLIVRLGFGWEGRVLGDLVSLGIFALIGACVLVRKGWIQHGLNREHLRHAIAFGGGLIPHVYGGLLIAATDRLLITHMIGLSSTGLYAVGAQVALIIAVLAHSFNQAWIPWLFDKLNNYDARVKRTIQTITRVYNVSILIAAAILTIIAPWFLGFFIDIKFAAATQFILWFAMANAFDGMYKMVVNQIFYANKTYLLGWTTLGTGIVNAILTYFMIRAFGALGAAQATAIAFLLLYLVTAFLSDHVTKEMFESGGKSNERYA